MRDLALGGGMGCGWSLLYPGHQAANACMLDVPCLVNNT